MMREKPTPTTTQGGPSPIFQRSLFHGGFESLSMCRLPLLLVVMSQLALRVLLWSLLLSLLLLLLMRSLLLLLWLLLLVLQLMLQLLGSMVLLPQRCM